MISLDRTEPQRREFAWLPPHLKVVRWTTAASIWTGVTAGTLLTLVAGGPLAHLALVLGAGGIYAGNRASHAVVRGRLRQLARGAVDFARVAKEPDGELIHMTGVVRAREVVPGLLHGAPSVWRRVTFVLHGKKMVHEAAADFDLCDTNGDLITVEVAGARMFAPEVERADYPVARFFANPPVSLARLIDPRRERLERKGHVEAGEFLLRAGDTIEVVGYKSRVVDPRVEMRLSRDTPMRATLRSGRALPLLVTPHGRDLPREV